MKKQSILHKDGVSYVIPFVLITFCFALWGFANDITNPMVKAFSKIFRTSVTEGALVQVAFYGDYFAMEDPSVTVVKPYLLLLSRRRCWCSVGREIGRAHV